MEIKLEIKQFLFCLFLFPTKRSVCRVFQCRKQETLLDISVKNSCSSLSSSKMILIHFECPLIRKKKKRPTFMNFLKGTNHEDVFGLVWWWIDGKILVNKICLEEVRCLCKLTCEGLLTGRAAFVSDLSPGPFWWCLTKVLIGWSALHSSVHLDSDGQ